MRDIQALRETGQVCRRVADLDIPAAAWRVAIRDIARVENFRIRTFLIPDASAGGEPTGFESDGPHLPAVCAVRTDPTPEALESRTDPVWWRRVDDLPVMVGTWRAVLRSTARREGIAIRTFLVPPTCEADDLTTQLVYAVWIDPSHGSARHARHGRGLPIQRPRGVAVVRVLPRIGSDVVEAGGPDIVPIAGPAPPERGRDSLSPAVSYWR